MADAQKDMRDGVLSGVIAYTIWGFLPIYFLLLQSVSSLEILTHRIIWAVPFGAIIIYFRRQWPEVRGALKHKPTVTWLIVAALFIAINWYIYILAVQHGQIFQASLGYYINPLIYVLVGVVFLGEKLRSSQFAAVALATIGVLVLTFSGGQFPYISIAIAISFTIYGVIRKRVVIGGMPGLFIETVVLFPFAASWLLWAIWTQQAEFGTEGAGLNVMLLLAGPVTVVPLLLFALAARRVPLSTLGFMQFIGPTLQFVVGVVHGEPLSTAHIICFGFVWAGVIVFSVDAVRSSRRKRRVAGHNKTLTQK
jgi:chloramphenicol-sensitive protein RarD